MTKMEVNVPDYLAKQAFAVAEREKVSVDQIVAMALSAQIAAWKGGDDMETRAKRANPADFDRIMAKVPDVPPMPRVTNRRVESSASSRFADSPKAAGEKPAATLYLPSAIFFA